MAQAGSCSTVPLAGKFLLLISLLTWLSTRMQSLENSIEGSMKLGPVKTGQDGYLKCSIPSILPGDLLCGCLTHSQSFLWHQGLSWTTAYMSPQRSMQADLAKSSDLNLTLWIENFIKDKVSEILLLLNILTGAIGRIWHPSQP